MCVPSTATVGSALDVAFDHEYEQLPVLSANKDGARKLIGYLDIRALRADVENQKINKTQNVLQSMVKFERASGESASKKEFTLISPETGLGELEGERWI